MMISLRFHIQLAEDLQHGEQVTTLAVQFVPDDEPAVIRGLTTIFSRGLQGHGLADELIEGDQHAQRQVI